MGRAEKFTAKGEPWDTGELGRDGRYVKRAAPENESEVDQALGLQLISIRLQKRMIEELKFIAKAHGIGYQPLVRDILDRFIVHEVKKIVREVQTRKDLELEETERIAVAAQGSVDAKHQRRNRKAA